MKQPEHGSMINGQALGEVSQLRYGLFPMSFNGCELIAICNALCRLGKPRNITEIAQFMERYSVLLGLFGCNVYRVGKGLEKFGVPFRRADSISDAEMFIVSYWTGRVLMSSVHTVFCTQENGVITVYNCANRCGEPRKYSSAEEAFGRHKPLAVYLIDPKES